MLLFIYFLLNYCLSTGDIERFNKFFDIFKDKTYIDKLGTDEMKIIAMMINAEFLSYVLDLKKRGDDSEMKAVYAVFIKEIEKFQNFIGNFFNEKIKGSTENETLIEFSMNLIKESSFEIKTKHRREIALYFLTVTVLKIRKILIDKTDELIELLIKDGIEEGEIVNKYFTQMTDYAKTMDYNDIYAGIKNDFLLKVKV